MGKENARFTMKRTVCLFGSGVYQSDEKSMTQYHVRVELGA